VVAVDIRSSSSFGHLWPEVIGAIRGPLYRPVILTSKVPVLTGQRGVSVRPDVRIGHHKI
jgi:hypothetical protein